MKNEIKYRKEYLIETVEKELSKAREMIETDADVIVVHQDAFAADYQINEYYKLGMLIKYIGEVGKEIRIIGKNRETLDDTKTKQLEEVFSMLEEYSKDPLKEAEELSEVLDTMEKYGGSFIKALALAWRHADYRNSTKLKKTFIEDYKYYKNAVKLTKITAINNHITS